MKDRIIGILVCVMLIITTVVVITPNDLNVKATLGDGGGGDIELDYQYIWNITNNLSRVIFNAYGIDDLRKGREFGSEGEDFAAKQIIKPAMIALDIDSPPELKVPYLDQIQDKWYPSRLTHAGNEGLNEKIDIHARKFIINHTQNGSVEVDCYIRPLTNGTRSDKWWLPVNNDELNHNFSYSALKIINESEVINHDFSPFENDTYNYVVNNYDFTDENNIPLIEIIETLFENYYNFTFDDIDASENTTWPPFINDINPNEDFIMITEAPEFNPKKYSQFNATIFIHTGLCKVKNMIKDLKELIIKLIYDGDTNEHCVGCIYYDYTNNTFNNGVAGDSHIFRIFVNGSIGNTLVKDLHNYTVDFYLNQSYNTSVESYNVIGQIDGIDQTKTVILDSLYDSHWNQGTSDAAVSCGMALAIAKKMKALENIDILPKYKIKIIMFGGEEWGYKGAKYYVANNSYENITTVIDLNQLAMTRPNPETDPPLITNLITNNLGYQHILETIYLRSNYEEKTGYEPKSLYSKLGAPSNDNAFTLRGPFKTGTICFLKDSGWYLHHRDGMDHTEGDVMKNIDWNDANHSADLVWNITKFFTYNPDTNFDGDPTFTLYDTIDDGEYDCLNVTYCIDTDWPCEQVTVNLVLFPKYTNAHPIYPLLYRLREQKNYMVTSEGISGYINVTLPGHFPMGEYVAQIYLCNSSGDILLDTVYYIGLKTLINGLELIQLFNEDILNIDFLVKLMDLKDLFGIDVVDWLKRLPDLRNSRIRELLLDFLGYYVFADDTYFLTGFNMHPPNRPPNTPDAPTDAGTFMGLNFYQTKTTDPDNGDMIRFQWDWDSNIYCFWSFRKYNQNEDHIKSHFWASTGEKNISVRAKNPWSPNVFSSWSDCLPVAVNQSCYFNIITDQSSQSNVNNPNIQTSYNPYVVPVDETVSYHGYSIGLEGTPDYSYNFNGDEIRSEKNPVFSFTETGLKFINLTVSSGGEEIFYNITVDVVNISSCFTMDTLGVQPNNTVFFYDTTICKNNIVNWTWCFRGVQSPTFYLQQMYRLLGEKWLDKPPKGFEPLTC